VLNEYFILVAKDIFLHFKFNNTYLLKNTHNVYVIIIRIYSYAIRFNYLFYGKISVCNVKTESYSLNGMKVFITQINRLLRLKTD